jgi:hypothetical protein
VFRRNGNYFPKRQIIKECIEMTFNKQLAEEDDLNKKILENLSKVRMT